MIHWVKTKAKKKIRKNVTFTSRMKKIDIYDSRVPLSELQRGYWCCSHLLLLLQSLRTATWEETCKWRRKPPPHPLPTPFQATNTHAVLEFAISTAHASASTFTHIACVRSHIHTYKRANRHYIQKEKCTWIETIKHTKNEKGRTVKSSPRLNYSPKNNFWHKYDISWAPPKWFRHFLSLCEFRLTKSRNFRDPSRFRSQVLLPSSKPALWLVNQPRSPVH